MRGILILPLGVLALAGCGGGGKPAIAPAVAHRLAGSADAVAASAAAGDSCAAARHATALQAATTHEINADAIPSRYQETLLARATELVAELQVKCLPTPAAAPHTPPPAPAEPAATPPAQPQGHAPARGRDHGHGHGHGEQHGHGHEHGHGRGHGH